MKKLIAISVMCALAAGAAFADVTVGGQIFVGGQLLKGDNVDDAPGADVNRSHLETGAIELDAYNSLLKLTFGNTQAGGWLGIHNNGSWYHGFGWWRPIPQLRLQIGRNQDGDFGNPQISGWGFNGEAKNVNGKLAAMGEYGNGNHGLWSIEHARTNGWYGGVSSFAFEASIFAIDGLAINLALPIGDSAAGFTFSRFHINLQYRIVDVGNATLTFTSNTGYMKADAEEWWKTEQKSMPSIYASFYVLAIENIGIDIGAAYTLPLSVKYNYQDADEKDLGVSKTVTDNSPIKIGVGFRFVSGNFTFKLRSGIEFGANQVIAIDGEDTQTIDADSETKISVNILPSYKINNITVYLGAGIGISSVADKDKTVLQQYIDNDSASVVEWYVNPYVLVPAGDLRFFLGFQLSSTGVNGTLTSPADPDKNGPIVKWSVPFGFYTYF